ncbi:helix-turn-helix transcriptional regulator [Stenotrophomonas terrae]|uniref:helix-turn-helix domain-containing protein n=1 Tax=Stenotrophomonas terrae TaxID=405446 RepID=UPI00320A8420
MLVGEIVSHLMESQGLTQRALAARVRANGAPNVKYQHIQQLLDIPTRTPRYLPALARAFGLTVEQFLAVDGSEDGHYVVDEPSAAYGASPEPSKRQSQPLLLEPATLASSYQLVRLACKALDDSFNPEDPGDAQLVLLAYSYLAARKERAVTPDNVVDFMSYLRKQQGTGAQNERGASATGTGTGTG